MLATSARQPIQSRLLKASEHTVRSRETDLHQDMQANTLGVATTGGPSGCYGRLQKENGYRAADIAVDTVRDEQRPASASAVSRLQLMLGSQKVVLGC